MERRQHQTPFLSLDRLERELDRPRAEWTEDTLIELFREHDVRVLSLMHVGGDGWLKTLDFVPRSTEHLRSILRGGERADGSSLFAETGIPAEASDIVLRPRIRSAFMNPFSSMRTLVLLCGHRARDGKPLPQSPDTIVRRAARRLVEEAGSDLWALGEVEYFLGKRRDEADVYGADDRGYHATAPFVFGENLRREALAMLADIGVPVKYGHSEVGYVEAMGQADGILWEQHEVELALMPLPAAADAIVLVQWVLRNLAHERGMQCSTDPMLLAGHAGNGLHFHFSPRIDGRHEGVRGADRRLSDPARWLIAGLVQTGGALMAFGNRAPGSLVRLSQGKEAPNRIRWGEFDRQALIRLPVVPADESGRPVTTPTVEFRLPDGSALPHLLLAGAAQAMAHARHAGSLDELLERTSAVHAAARHVDSEGVPGTFPEVGDALLRYREVFEAGNVFPGSLIDQTVSRLKR